MKKEHDLWYSCALSSRRYELWSFWGSNSYEIFEVLANTVVISRKTVILRTVVISRETVKWAKNRICDSCALNSQSYEIFDVLANKVVISRKTVKWAKNTICDICVLNSRRYEILKVSARFGDNCTQKL